MPTQTTSGAFERAYGRETELRARSPGRINLIGEHVDYQDGLVMPAAIDRYITAHAAANDGDGLRLWSDRSGGAPLCLNLGELAPLGGRDAWGNYVIGVIAKYREKGVRTGGFDIAFESDLPSGAGLSSSAALESATALIVEALAKVELPPEERALLCQAAEHEFAGMPCGIMDQLAVNAGVHGHALRIDCRTLDVSPAPLPDGVATVVIDSGVKHALADGEYAKRRADCEEAAQILGVNTLRDSAPEAVDAARGPLGERLYRRASHVVTEIERVRASAAALEGGRLEDLGPLMAASHASLRDQYEVSCPELDTLVEAAGDLGAIGSRMMGGGFGGSTINLIAEDHAERIASDICSRYHQAHEAEVPAIIVQAVGAATLLD